MPTLAQFKSSPFYAQMTQLDHYVSQPGLLPVSPQSCQPFIGLLLLLISIVNLDKFRIFRVLGRGAFGAVSAVQKKDTHALFAMKEMSKKKIKSGKHEHMVMREQNVLATMRSQFVLSLRV
jgi:serine/threonine protein kinase